MSRRHHRARVRLHLRATAPAGVAGRLRGQLERRPGAGRPAAGARARTRRSCSASGSGPRPAPSCSCRPPTPARPNCENQGVRPPVFFGERWITSHLRPVRGERPVLPGAAAGDHRRGPGGGAGLRAGRPGCRSCGCTTGPSTAGTGRCTTSSTDGRTCGWRTGCCRPDRPSSTCWPTRRSTTARSQMLSTEERPVWTKMSFDAAQGQLRRRRPAAASTRCSTGRASARSPGTNCCCAICCRWPTRAWPAGASPMAVRDRYLGIVEDRCKTRRNGRPGGRSETVAALRGRGLDRRRRAHRDAQAVLAGHALQRAGAHLGGSVGIGVRTALPCGSEPAQQPGSSGSDRGNRTALIDVIPNRCDPE